ncbi:MAG: radical SAM protein [Candidatus Margulisbacteria bacterium]|nr:radical SAM protein [Candidatus Margulisiibacteriota bacterium]
MRAFKNLLVNEQIKALPFTKSIIKHFKNIPVAFFKPAEEQNIIKKFNRADVLLLTGLKGSFLKKCPGTTEYSCCNYYILNTEINCPFSCSYCILQDYFELKAHVIYTDIDELLLHLPRQLKKLNKEKMRIGTGEFTDSLALDNISGISLKLISFFKDYPHILLELKTKSLNVGNLLTITPPGNIIVGWSVNTDKIIQKVERNTPSLLKRLEAAQKLAQAGYKLSFHFDPIIFYEEMEKDYKKVIDLIYRYVPAEKISWISLGCLRFTKGLMQSFFKKSPGFIDEFIVGDDNKLRYLRPRRVRAYKTITGRIKKYNPEQFIYLCMESQTVWKQVFGFSFETNEDFEKWFNDHVFEKQRS